jgi:hypothetical protein
MTPHQQTQLRQYRAIVQYVRGHGSLLRREAILFQKVTALSIRLHAIDAIQNQQSLLLEGLSHQQQAMRENMCRMAADIASLVYTMAGGIRRKILQKSVSIQYGRLMRLTDAALLLAQCRSIYETAISHIGDLEVYGLSIVNLKIFQNTIDLFDTVVSPPRLVTSLITHYLNKMEQLLAEARVLLQEDIIPLVSFLKDKEEKFYKGFMHLFQKIALIC